MKKLCKFKQILKKNLQKFKVILKKKLIKKTQNFMKYKKN